MLTSLTRTKTFWAVVVILLGYGIVTWDDDPASERAPDPHPTDDKVEVVFEVAMADTRADWIYIAISATLGSAGNFSVKKDKLWEGLRHIDRPYHHHFFARRGDPLNAEVANLSAPVTMMMCTFFQKGQGDDAFLKGYGDITGVSKEAANGGTLARCTAVVR